MSSPIYSSPENFGQQKRHISYTAPDMTPSQNDFSLLFHLFLRQVYMAQPGISPGIGAMKNDDLITGIQDYISSLCRDPRIITHDVLPDRADLLEAAIHGHLNDQWLFSCQFLQRIYRIIFFPGHRDLS